MKTRIWTVTVENLDTKRMYTVCVETETNYRAAARVKALDRVYDMPGMTWQSNLIVVTCMLSRRAA